MAKIVKENISQDCNLLEKAMIIKNFQILTFHWYSGSYRIGTINRGRGGGSSAKKANIVKINQVDNLLNGNNCWNKQANCLYFKWNLSSSNIKEVTYSEPLTVCYHWKRCVTVTPENSKICWKHPATRSSKRQKLLKITSQKQCGTACHNKNCWK